MASDHLNVRVLLASGKYSVHLKISGECETSSQIFAAQDTG